MLPSPSRPLRPSLRDLCVFCRSKPHCLVFFTFRIGFNAKNAKIFAKIAKTLPRTFQPSATVLAP
ncbi:MAG: hypothetical protein R2682_07975 [Pyrinomonadaceae bacterium]